MSYRTAQIQTGYATTPGRTDDMQAAWWVRAMATFLSHPRITHIGVYEIKDLSPEREAIGDTPNHHLGLTHVDRTRKLAFSTVRMLIGLLDAGRISPSGCGAYVTRPLSSGYCHVFVRPDGARVLIAWTRETPQVIQLTLDEGAASVTEHALDGRTHPQTLEPDAPTLDIHLRPGVPRVFRIDPAAAP